MTAATAATALRELSDSELVARIVAGDDALFEIVMRRNNQRIYRVIRAILGDDQEVEDVMQQAYLNAYRNLRGFEGRAQLSTWLTRIAVNEALARRGKRHIGNEDESLLHLLESNAPSPEQETFATELRDAMQRELAALPQQFRAVLMLRDVEGLSTSETAAVLDISEDLVKTRLSRARTLLRNNLYRHAGVTLQTLFEFGNARCDRVVTRVMARLQRAFHI